MNAETIIRVYTTAFIQLYKLCLQTLTFILSPANMLNTDKVTVKLLNRTMKCLVKGIEPCSEYKFSCFY